MAALPHDVGLTPPRSHVAAANRRTAYEVVFQEGASASALLALRPWIAGQDHLVVTTPTVQALHGGAVAGLDPTGRRILVLDCTEASKTLQQVERVCRRAHELGLSRGGVLLAVGGGVCSDITTLAASWLRRGIRHVRVPTTLVGQVDAGLGYKGAVNFDGHKSYLGCFHAPAHVLIAPDFLRTLPARHQREGFAEIVKIAIVCDPDLLNLVDRHAEELVRTSFAAPRAAGRAIVWQSALLMLRELEQNPYEDQGYERLVDFGHTFSPLLEAASAHRLSHGEAVAIDMALTMALSAELGLVAPASRDRILSLLRRLGLPTDSPLLTPELCRHALEQAALHRGGRPNLVLPTDFGPSRFLQAADAVGPDLIARGLRALAHPAGTVGSGATLARLGLRAAGSLTMAGS
ncbi:iron-containing alcohol dehydrogenase [Methylobacterium currus]|uniref:3-dehydroquinate synthase family protein n=1 Tax=Methylobacterium currus TaxID=2051553 RepID=UPI001E499885|nr:iron-containing alcohol dehydrogenase [Methylobacterium currus]UHC17605.1 iron-containing alcohol dehydrogenase [Methylobacterium currus]